LSVPALVTAVVLLAVIVAAGRRPDSTWPGFAAWTLAGFLSAFASISLGIGLLVLPFAVVAIVAAARVGVRPAVGFIAGAGLVGVLVWSLNVGDRESADYSGWLGGGVALALASTLAFAWRRRI
jgi:hypothetical protein